MKGETILQPMALSDILIIVILLAGGAVSAFTRKLTWPAAATGVVLGCLIFKGGGAMGLLLLAVFFLLGTTATSWGLRQKQAMGIAEERSGRRTAGQVLANAGVAGIIGLIAIFFPDEKLWFLSMMAGSFAAATADTLSSELGNLYGRRFYNILTFRKDQRGLDGVISREGTLYGLIGSILIATLFSVVYGFRYFLWIVMAGTAGNLADSFLGATVERRGWLQNNAVNFLNTLVGALVAAAPHLNF